VKIFKSDNLVFVNKNHKKRILNIRVDDMFKPEFQDMFFVSEKKGFLKLVKNGVVSAKKEPYVIVLTNCGLLCLDPNKVSFHLLALADVCSSRRRYSSHCLELVSRTLP
jgi:hypothetical protein